MTGKAADIMSCYLSEQVLTITLRITYTGIEPLDRRRREGISEAIAKSAQKIADDWRLVKYADETSEEHPP